MSQPDETAIQTAVQTTIQSITGFKDARVTINDYAVLDGYIGEDPIAIILNSDDFRSDQTGFTPQNEYMVKVDLIVPNQTNIRDAWHDFRNKRAAIVSEFNEVGTNRSPGGGSVTADIIRSDGDILPIYESYISEEDMRQAIPIFWSQIIVLEVSTF